MTTQRFALIRPADLEPVGGTRDTSDKVMRPGDGVRVSTGTRSAVSLQEGDVLFVVDPEQDDWVLVGIAGVSGRGPMANTPHGVAATIIDFVGRADGLTLPASTITDALKKMPPVFPRQISQAPATSWLDAWDEHLVSLGRWGDLTAARELEAAFAEAYSPATRPSLVRLPPNPRANSEGNFPALTTALDAPVVFAMARTYLLHVGLGASEYSISALPSTGATNDARRAFTVSVGVTEAAYVVLDMRTGTIDHWGARVPVDRETALYRWHDLDFRRCPWGSYVEGYDPRSLFRTLGDADEARVLFAGAEELVQSGKAYRKSDWHNPYFERALLDPPFSTGSE